MKSILFEVSAKDMEFTSSNKSEFPYEWKLNIPILSAFSVEYFSIQDGASVAFSTKNDKVDGNILTIEAEYPITQDIKNVTVVVQYHGIRDYSLLFPWINDEELRVRLGEFYEEAEKNFDTGAWLSFALMCGAVFEGMLFAKLNLSKNYYSLLLSATEEGLISINQRENMDKVRALRNLVHGNNFKKEYILRKDAMDIRKTLSDLLKDFSE